MNSKGQTFLKKGISLLLCAFLFLGIFCTALTINASAAGEITLGANSQIDEHLDGALDADWYKVEPTEETYYRFSIRNQSAELRSGIAFVDSAVNFFLSNMQVEIFDQLGNRIARVNVRCGYTNSINVKLYPGNTYSVKVTSTIAGNYRISTKTIADIGPDNWQDALEVDPNANIVSAVDTDSDKDWYTFTADSERSYYNFKFENLSKTGSQQFWLYEYVAGAGETPWRDITNFSVSEGQTRSISLQLKEGGKYAYCIMGKTGGYVLDVEQTLDVAGPSFDTSYPIDLNTTYTTTFDGTEDVDYFNLKTDKDNAYYHVNFEALKHSGTAYVNLYDSAGNLVKGNSKYNTGTLSFNAQLKPDSTYFVYIKGANVGNYTISVDKRADTYYNEREQSTAISFGKTYKTTFDGDHDDDYIKFTTDSDNAYYYIEKEVLSCNGYSYMYLFDSDGNQINYADIYKTGTSTINNLLEPNSTYYVCFMSDYLGNYNFTITKRADPFLNEMDEATEITVGKEYSTSFDGHHDDDYIKFTTGNEYAYYYIEKNVLSCGGYSYTYLFDSNKNQINYADIYKTGKSTVIHRLEPNSTYYVCFMSDYVGNYKFTVSKQVDADSNERENATSIKLNSVYDTRLESNSDVDWFKFTAPYDDDYRIYVTNETGNLYLDLYNSREGNEYYGTFSSELDKVVFLEAGTYYIKVSRYINNPKYYSLAVADCGSAHKEKATYTKKAGINVVGTKKTVCSKCGKVIKTERVAAISSVKLSKTKYTYNGAVQKPSVTVTDTNGNKVKSYSVKWTNSSSKNAGTYKATITFSGAYSGSKTLTYTISPIKSSTCKVKLSSSSYTYNGKTKTPSVTVKNAKGSTLKKDTDYTVTYASGRKNIGKYKVTVKFKGNYSGTETLYFTINPKIKLSETEYTYNGKTKKPSVKVTSSSGSKISSKYYTVSYSSGRKNVGKYTVTVKFKNGHSGTYKYTFTINPAKTSLKKVSGASKSLKVSINKKTTQVTGYEIQYSTSKKFTKPKTVTVKSAKTTSTTIKKLSAKKTYYVRVRTYKTVSGKKYYSGWSSYKSAKTK